MLNETSAQRRRESVSLGHFQNCKPLKMEIFRNPGVEDEPKVPAKYPLRRYPDITHSRHSEFPVPDWDLAFASTEGREVIKPRPTQEARIFHIYEKYAIGFLTYSEGVNDDVNKFVWSGLGWNPSTPVADFLRDLGRYRSEERPVR